MSLTQKQKDRLTRAKNSGAVGALTKSTKPLSGLASLNASGSLTKASEINSTSNTILDKTTHYSKEPQGNKAVLKINPNYISNWKYNDRPESELGDINELSKDILQNGQIQPCVVRKLKNSPNKYELIVGERRWRACKLIEKDLNVIVSNINDEEAFIIQASENDQRKNLSDYARGMHYHKIIDNKIFTEESLAKKLNKSKSYVRQLLSFQRLHHSLVTAISNLSNISSRTAAEMLRWQNKGKQFLDILITLAPKLREGNIGEKKLVKLIEKSVIQKPIAASKTEMKTNEGEVIFYWDEKANGNISITLTKKYAMNFDKEKIKALLVGDI